MPNIPIMTNTELSQEIKKTPLIFDSLHKGTSIKDAIVILGTKNSQLGIAYEHVYLDFMFPKHTFLCQSLKEENGKAYDIMEIKTSENRTVEIYFDISEFYFD